MFNMGGNPFDILVALEIKAYSSHMFVTSDALNILFIQSNPEFVKNFHNVI